MSDISKITYGGDLMLFVASGSCTVQPIAFSTNASLSVDLKSRSVASKDSGCWDEKAPSKFSYSVSTDALYSYGLTGSTQSVSKLWSMYNARCLVKMGFGAKCGTTPAWGMCSTNNFTGCVLITKLDFKAADDNTVTYSMSAEGSGALCYC
jgi:predicted secreted protein